METKKLDFKAQLHARAEKHFKAHVTSEVSRDTYCVTQLHGDDDTVKLWRCGKPQSSTYMFYVCSAPNCLMVYGDVGEFMWQRHYDMIPFIRGAIESLDYFSEKVPRGIEIKTEYEELVEEWALTIKEERALSGHDWDDSCDTALAEIMDAYAIYGSVHDFQSALFDSKLCTDYEDMPDLQHYTYSYLWVIEGLKWFIKELDASNVVKPAVEDNQS